MAVITTFSPLCAAASGALLGSHWILFFPSIFFPKISVMKLQVWLIVRSVFTLLFSTSWLLKITPRLSGFCSFSPLNQGGASQPRIKVRGCLFMQQVPYFH